MLGICITQHYPIKYLWTVQQTSTERSSQSANQYPPLLEFFFIPGGLQWIDTFKNHKSVQRIKLANFHSKSTINVSKVTAESEVKKELLNLSSKKATRNGNIPAKILKKSVDIDNVSPYLCGFRKNRNAQYLLLKIVET